MITTKHENTFYGMGVIIMTKRMWELFNHAMMKTDAELIVAFFNGRIVGEFDYLYELEKFVDENDYAIKSFKPCAMAINVKLVKNEKIPAGQSAGVNEPKHTASTRSISFWDDDLRYHIITGTTKMNIRNWVVSIIETYDLDEFSIVSVHDGGKLVYKNNSLFVLIEKWIDMKTDDQRTYFAKYKNFKHEIWEK